LLAKLDISNPVDNVTLRFTEISSADLETVLQAIKFNLKVLEIRSTKMTAAISP
jgi:hypothetical protein